MKENTPMRTHFILLTLLLLGCAGLLRGEDDRLGNRLGRPLPTSTDTVGGLPQLFEKSYRLRAGDAPLSVENPGYASPSLGDIDGDGIDELLVGQFRDGKILICKAAPTGHYGEGSFLEAGGDVARIPGVW